MSTLAIVIFVAGSNIYFLVRTLVSPARSCSSHSIHTANCSERGVSRHSSPYGPVGQRVLSAVNPNRVVGPRPCAMSGFDMLIYLTRANLNLVHWRRARSSGPVGRSLFCDCVSRKLGSVTRDAIHSRCNDRSLMAPVRPIQLRRSGCGCRPDRYSAVSLLPAHRERSQ
jgi:hypothetical protein